MLKLFLLVPISISACAAPRAYTQLTEQVVNNGLEKYCDKDNGVCCYFYKDSDNVNVSCVKK